MKPYFVLTAFFLVFSCQKDTEETIVPLTTSNILGSWQLKSSYVSPGGDTEWGEVEDGYIFKFNSDATFTQNKTIEGASDKSGTYILSDDIFQLTYSDGGKQASQHFSIEMSKTIMTLSPAGPSFCIEPCLYRYRKVD